MKNTDIQQNNSPATTKKGLEKLSLDPVESTDTLNIPPVDPCDHHPDGLPGTGPEQAAPGAPLAEPSKVADSGDGSGGSGKKPKKTRHPFKAFFKFVFFMGFCFSILGAVAAVGMYMWISNDLPSFSKVADYRPPQVTSVLARDGSLIGQFYREKRFMITMNEMSPILPKAFLAAEDSDFYSHPGIDLKAILRAFITNLRSGDNTSGGSTITQQIIKRLMLTPEKSYERKMKEAILAYRLERQFSKDEILNLYLNQIFLGNNSYGVEAAARTYFAKHASELTLAEAALIAGLPQSPSAYNPYRRPEAAKTRQQYVLRRLRDLTWISESEYEQALYEPLEFKSMNSGMGRVGGWYLEEVRRQLVDMFSEQNAAKNGLDFGLYGEDAVYQLGLTVHTSMDPFQQEAADQGLRHGLEDATKRHGWRGPVKELEPSQYDTFLAENPFSLETLEKGEWLQALVVAVDKNGARVRLGNSHQGIVSVKTMGWARTPNKRVAGSVTATVIQDATRVVKIGDVIWVSYWAEPTDKDVPAVHLGQVTPDTPVPLRLEQYPDVQGAMVSIEPQTGDVVAMVGGYSFGYHGSQFNRATQAQRQPGSAFKPIVYSASLDNGFTAGSMVLDAPILIVNEWTREAWRPRNFDGKFEGPMRLNRALARSRNLCTVRVAQTIGLDPVIKRAKELGLTPHFPAEMAISLGAVAVSPINMTQAYTAFANNGLLSTPRLIQSIQGSWGNTIYENPPHLEQVISPANAYIMSSMLKDVVNMGTATRAKRLERPLGGKTGSTNDENDAWFLAVTPYLVTGTYIGYDQVEPMGRGETGSLAALPTFLYYAEKAYEAYDPVDFVAPPDIVYAQVDQYYLPFMLGTQPGTGYGFDAMMEGGYTGDTGSAPDDDLLKGLF